MSIFDQARALGKEMLECEEAQKLYAARDAFEQDETAKALVEQYSQMKGQWEEIMTDEGADKTKLTDLGEKIVALENKIKENAVTLDLMKAESEYGAFVNSVFNLISATVQGKDASESGCGAGGCAGCSGCH